MEVLKDLWKDKPLFITVCVGIIGIAFILYKQNSANLVAPSASGDAGAAISNANTGAGPGPGNGTFVEYSYYNSAPVSNVFSSPAPVATAGAGASGTPISKPLPQVVKPSPKGLSTAGKHDTNWSVYTARPGDTLLSITRNIAKWGNDTATFTHYRNNQQIFKAAGVNIANPLSPVPAGLQVSV